MNHTQGAFNLIFGNSVKKTMPATQIDPECNTAAYEARLNDSEAWLRENPESLLEVEVDDLVAIWKAHHGDKLNLGEVFDRYMEGLIQEQARSYTE